MGESKKILSSILFSIPRTVYVNVSSYVLRESQFLIDLLVSKLCQNDSEVHSEPCQTSKMKLFAKLLSSSQVFAR